MFYEIQKPVFLDKEAFQAGEFLFKSGGEVSSDLGVKGVLEIRNVGVFGDAEVTKLTQWLQQHKDAVCIQRPTIASLNGQRASVQIGETRDFTVAYKAVQAADGSIDSQPVNEKVQTGINCEVQAVTIKPANEDDVPTTEVSVQFRRANIKSVSKFTFSGTDGELTTEQPVVVAATFQTTRYPLKLDQSLVVVQSHENKTLVTIVHCKPIDTNAPPVPPAALGNGDKPAYVTVTDALKSDSEFALMKCILAKLDIKDSRIDDGRMQVSVTEDWKAAVNAFQELREFRNSSSDADSSTTANARKFANDGAAHEPLPVYGPLIQRACVIRGVPVLSRIPYVHKFFRDIDFIDDIEQSAPTDKEVMHAVEKQSKDTGLSDAIYAGKIKVKSKLIIQSYDEPLRFLPLANDAYQQHRHYKCALHDAKTDELKSVVYVDYCQFVLKKIGTKQSVLSLP